MDLYCRLRVYSFLLARDCDGSFSHIDARMNVQRFVFLMLILVLDMAIRGEFRSKDAISKSEEFVFARDDVQRIIIDLFQHPAGNLHLRRVRARATRSSFLTQSFPPYSSISCIIYIYIYINPSVGRR